jgi:hypothetical protein
MACHGQGKAPIRSADVGRGGAGLFVGASTLLPEVFPRVRTVTWALGQPPASRTLRAGPSWLADGRGSSTPPVHEDRDRSCRLRRRRLRPSVWDNSSRLAVASSSTCTCAASLSS